MTLGTRYFGIDLRTMTDANGVKVAWWCIWCIKPRFPKTGPYRLGYLYGSVRNAMPEEVSMPDPVDLPKWEGNVAIEIEDYWGRDESY